MSVWPGVNGAAIRDEFGFEYIGVQNSLYHPDKNAIFTLRHDNSFVSPAVIVLWDDANKPFRNWTPFKPNLTYVDETTALYSKRAFKYGAYVFWLRFPDPSTDPTFFRSWVGGETSGGFPGGITTFFFEAGAGVLNTYLYTSAINRVFSTPIVNSLLPINPTADQYLYLVKVNRASVEYWVQGSLVGIVQFVPGSNTYDVRTTAPYYLGQLGGAVPAYQPCLMEYACSAQQYIGSISNIQLANISITDGDPAPPRTLFLYTNGVNWEGTAVNPNITSDRVPIAGYDKKQIMFLATGNGTLEIYVDYGDNALDRYDSVSVSANTLLSYLTEVEAPWLALKYTPTTPPANIIRAKVLMS